MELSFELKRALIIVPTPAPQTAQRLVWPCPPAPLAPLGQQGPKWQGSWRARLGIK